MSEPMCRYDGDREHAIVSYLYEDRGDPAYAAFSAHVAVCDRCRQEVAALRTVRTSLGGWTAPDLEPAVARTGGPGREGAWFARVPAWAQAAAAVLCLGLGAGLANLDVQYGAFHVRTGWSARATPSPPAPAVSAPWRPELTALEQRLRSELEHRASPPAAATASAAVPGGTSADAETLKRVRAVVDESERRQQRELALRLAEVLQSINTQRQADLVRIDRSIGAMQSNTGLEILRQRETINSINNYLVRTASQQRPQ